MRRIQDTCVLIAGFILLSVGCKEDKAITEADSPYKGTIRLSVDESFRPVMEEQVKAYEAANPETHLEVSYLPEADCLKNLFFDSLTRMAVVTRGLSQTEENFLNNKLGFNPTWNLLAGDAIAVIVNKQSADTLFTLDRLRNLLSGKAGASHSVVFDGLTATSSFRFLKDSVLKEWPLDTTVVKAAANSQAVIDYVAGNRDAIGFIGVSWIGNPEDTSHASLLKKVSIAYVKCEWCEDDPYVKPVQQTILNNRYPLVRGLYYVLKENYYGLGSGFADFLKYERGQLIFKRAYLAPVMDFSSRNIKINQKLPNN